MKRGKNANGYEVPKTKNEKIKREKSIFLFAENFKNYLIIYALTLLRKYTFTKLKSIYFI